LQQQQPTNTLDINIEACHTNKEQQQHASHDAPGKQTRGLMMVGQHTRCLDYTYAQAWGTYSAALRAVN
jgi:hypothetical protein